jgi:hypothetical protein
MPAPRGARKGGWCSAATNDSLTQIGFLLGKRGAKVWATLSKYVEYQWGVFDPNHLPSH